MGMLIGARCRMRPPSASIAVVPMASKIALFAIQYLTVRVFVKRQIMAEMAGARLAEPQAQAA